MNDDKNTNRKLKQMLEALKSGRHNRPNPPAAKDILSTPPGQRDILWRIRHAAGQNPQYQHQEISNNTNVIALPDQFPEGWMDSPLGKKALEIGIQHGFSSGLEQGRREGRREAWKEANTVIHSIRNILSLHDQNKDDKYYDDDWDDDWDDEYYDDEEF